MDHSTRIFPFPKLFLPRTQKSKSHTTDDGNLRIEICETSIDSEVDLESTKTDSESDYESESSASVASKTPCTSLKNNYSKLPSINPHSAATTKSSCNTPKLDTRSSNSDSDYLYFSREIIEEGQDSYSNSPNTKTYGTLSPRSCSFIRKHNEKFQKLTLRFDEISQCPYKKKKNEYRNTFRLFNFEVPVGIVLFESTNKCFDI